MNVGFAQGRTDFAQASLERAVRLVKILLVVRVIGSRRTKTLHVGEKLGFSVHEFTEARFPNLVI
jgi:hypothetical protein